MRRLLLSLAIATVTLTANAQWQIQTPATTADLRGIDNVGKGIAWASGTNGTVLRTEDGGYLWQVCTIPPGAEHLDFRGIQAFDNNTAIVMSSGKGDLSRLYKTTDGCQTWKLIFTNPDKDGFWDDLVGDVNGSGPLLLVGDPVNGRFPLWVIYPEIPKPDTFKQTVRGISGEAVFAASNSSLVTSGGLFWLGTGGVGGGRIIHNSMHGADDIGWVSYPGVLVPVGGHSESSGVFSLAAAVPIMHGRPVTLVAVGGDYKDPDNGLKSAAVSLDGGRHWLSSLTPPHGYRSAVVYDAPTKTWITVGPNGTDISTNDGRNWQALKPNPHFNDTPDADQHWNALSLPYAVGPHGRIGTLDPSTLKLPPSK